MRLDALGRLRVHICTYARSLIESLEAEIMIVNGMAVGRTLWRVGGGYAERRARRVAGKGWGGEKVGVGGHGKRRRQA
jgi:hypothetical protein